ncbi:MAG: hypothetical protein AAB612_04165 [Patescibacteria group bacterium]
MEKALEDDRTSQVAETKSILEDLVKKLENLEIGFKAINALVISRARITHDQWNTLDKRQKDKLLEKHLKPLEKRAAIRLVDQYERLSKKIKFLKREGMI